MIRLTDKTTSLPLFIIEDARPLAITPLEGGSHITVQLTRGSGYGIMAEPPCIKYYSVEESPRIVARKFGHNEGI